MVPVADLWRAPLVPPFAFAHLEGEVPEDAVEQVGGLEVRRVEQIEGALGVLADPRALVGGVVEHEVDDGEHFPVVVHMLDQRLHVLQRVGAAARREVEVPVEHGVELELVLEAVRRVGLAQLLYRGEVQHVVAGLLRHLIQGMEDWCQATILYWSGYNGSAIMGLGAK
jgi:hypothetical protein